MNQTSNNKIIVYYGNTFLRKIKDYIFLSSLLSKNSTKFSMNLFIEEENIKNYLKRNNIKIFINK